MKFRLTPTRPTVILTPDNGVCGRSFSCIRGGTNRNFLKVQSTLHLPAGEEANVPLPLQVMVFWKDG
jgi:hypothetical protein